MSGLFRLSSLEFLRQVGGIWYPTMWRKEGLMSEAGRMWTEKGSADLFGHRL